jgi:hypothetical protein
MELATLQPVYQESELSLALGISRRSAHRIAVLLGRRVGAKRLVMRADLLDWLSKQPQGKPGRPPRPKDAEAPAHEFRIR